MQWPQVTTRERHWKMKKSFSRSTLRGQKGFSEIDLKLGMVSKGARVGAPLLVNRVKHFEERLGHGASLPAGPLCVPN